MTDKELTATEKELVEKIASLDFCWLTCGEIANTCIKQSGCAAFGDRHNKSFSHMILDYRKANQILALTKKALPELAKEAGYVIVPKDFIDSFAKAFQERIDCPWDR